MTSLRRRLAIASLVFGALALGAGLLAPLVGSTRISLARALDRSLPFADNPDAQIFFLTRLPRVAAAMVVGATLASAGVVLQALMRNPLASPYTLGISSGAGLGAMIAITFGSSLTIGPFSPVPLAALAGALTGVAILYGLASRTGRALSMPVLLLAGVTLNAFMSAMVLFVQYLADFAQAIRALRWLMGDLDVGGFTPTLASLPLILPAFAIFAVLPSSLNLLSVDAQLAATRGVEVARTQRLAFFSASLATAGAVSLAGPIGFVGIVVPHLVRLLVGGDNRVVMPAAALFGASFLVGCDLIARTIMSPVELPIGVVTALIGGPFFLWLLVRRS
jgi:iron complex transport system permease protein